MRLLGRDRSPLFLVILMFLIVVPAFSQAKLKENASVSSARVRTYYIAADEIDWDYAPLGVDFMTGKPFAGLSAAYTQPGLNRIGHVFRKAIYREYTDETFTKLKTRRPEDEYLGLLGPVLHCAVGDTLKVAFKNNGTHPYSMHPHGVFYQKASEGSMYADGVPDEQKMGAMVMPGRAFTYKWDVPERAGPGPQDPSSIVWLYHSHVNEMRDVSTGLIGAIIVTARGQARPDGTPKGVDREIVALFTAFNEGQNLFIDQNIARYLSETDRQKLNKVETNTTDTDGNYSLAGTGFAEVNLNFSINGYLYGNGPVMTMRAGQHVRWYLLAIAQGFDFHSPHWHGNTVLYRGHRTDVIALSPAEMQTADMVPDNPGIWMFHCHVDDHMVAGMTARYEVKP
jgi:FtsP/CotA-like multicopper oxidase with cupredoxin domain